MDSSTTARERLDPGIHVTFPEVYIRKGDLLGNLKRFRDVIRTLKPTTMLTHNFGSIEWAMANRLSCIRHIHVEDGFGPEEREIQIPRRVWLRRFCLRGRDVVLPSQNLLRIAEDIWRLEQRRLHYIPNGIDLSRFMPATHNPSSLAREPVVGTVAALRPEKNVARLIRAFHLATLDRPAKLVIVGDGSQRTELEALTSKLNLDSQVHFAGHVAKPDGLIATFDIFAMSSDTEQMPISLLEAMAAGLPVVATDVGDTVSMLPNIGRKFVTACDDTALAGALATLIREPTTRADLGQACRAKAEKEFDQAQMFDRWSSLLGASL